MRRAEQSEDEVALRDAFHLTRPGADPGTAAAGLASARCRIGRAMAVCDRRRGGRFGVSSGDFASGDRGRGGPRRGR